MRAAAVIVGIAALVALVGAVWGGLGRMGLATGAPPEPLAVWHGALIVNGFFGTVLTLERALTLGRGALYAMPLAVGGGSWMVYAGWPVVGSALVVAGAVGFAGLHVWLIVRDREVHRVALALGAGAWVVSAVLLVAHVRGSGPSMGDLAPWWAAFLVLTFAGERLKAACETVVGRVGQALFFGSVAVFLGGIAAGLGGVAPGLRVAGIGAVGLAIWPAVVGDGWRRLRGSGMRGYVGRTYAGGYAWLAVGGALLIAYGGRDAGLVFDAQWHAIFVGYVLMLIFAHVPEVMQGEGRPSVAYHPVLYAAPGLLHLSLGARLYGDLAVAPGWRLVGGIGHAAAIAVFVVLVALRLERHP